MCDFIRRELTEFERLVSTYGVFVESVLDGYDMSIYEYTNDVSCRQRIEENKSDQEMRSMLTRVVAADEKLRNVLQPTSKCIHGEYSPQSFWYWGYPPNSPELEDDLRTLGMLESAE